ncbi:phosphatidylserine decarboxylase proenzyme-like [Tropilaelaps mercedesae]|uniref:Phosphatidylserine decarboxylase proenzyme-like n=1 Tax=Tropilaelaps mercedesae TaxID=418985 RepID=A0A1V9XF16_9ACAR|nr:phosphatidylserine decarboxylase proenzyme-like [Tropilaelaps mercedesae]
MVRIKAERTPLRLQGPYTSIYKLMPLRLASKCWGVINDISLPGPLRAPVIGAFSWYTGCDISEAALDDPREYANLSEFFRRTLKPGLRPIAPGDCVVSSNPN